MDTANPIHTKDGGTRRKSALTDTRCEEVANALVLLHARSGETQSIVLLPEKSTPQAFSARRFTALLLGDLTICLTFGAIYPPLAVVILIAIVVTCVHKQIVLGRFLDISLRMIEQTQGSDSVLQEQCANASSDKLEALIELKQAVARSRLTLYKYILVIVRETNRMGKMFVLSIAPITILAAMFWFFFLFDILGSDVGTMSALWMLFVLPGILVAEYIIARIIFPCLIACSGKPSSDTPQRRSEFVSTDGVELRRSTIIA